MESRSSGSVRSPLSVSARGALSFLLVLAALVLAGCQKPSRDDLIAAHNDQSFDEWVANHAGVLTPAEVRELTDARQNIRFREMQAKTGQPPDELAKAVYDAINGKTVRDVLVTSYTLQVDRVSTELANFQPQLKRFEEHQKNGGLSDEEKGYVAKSLATIQEKMKQREAERARLEARLEELKKSALPSS